MRWTLAAFLALSLGANLYLFLRVTDAEARVPYSETFRRPLIDRSIADYAARTGRAADEAMRHRFPVAARTANGVCVNLALEAGNLGSAPIYCYADDGRLTFRGER